MGEFVVPVDVTAASLVHARSPCLKDKEVLTVKTAYNRFSGATAPRYAVTRPGDPHRTVAPRTTPIRPVPVTPGAADALLYGVIKFEGPRRATQSVVLAFENATAADDYAIGSGFDDYLVVPLSFLTPTAPAAAVC